MNSSWLISKPWNNLWCIQQKQDVGWASTKLCGYGMEWEFRTEVNKLYYFLIPYINIYINHSIETSLTDILLSFCHLNKMRVYA